MSDRSLLDLSDEEILNMGSTPPLTQGQDSQQHTDDDNTQEVDDVIGNAAADDADAGVQTEMDLEEGQDAGSESDPDDAAEADVLAQEDGTETQADPNAPNSEKQEQSGKSETETDAAADLKQTAEPVDYKAQYEKLMAPFKANGKEVKVNSPEEAIQLMQMGANYTKKLQALQPQLKLLKMLEKNGLLAEDKLSYLIDLDKKDPAAIQKLLRDGNIDPMEIDTTAEPKYTPGNHRISDTEMNLTTVLEDISSNPDGKEMILQIHQNWDTQSKEIIGNDPKVLQVLYDHKQAGAYQKICDEVDRQRMLGHLQNVPFLNAYYQVGQALQSQGLLNPAPAATQAEPAKQVVATRPAQRKPETNGDKVRAAAPLQVQPKKSTGQEFNPLDLSDEEFEKTAKLARRL